LIWHTTPVTFEELTEYHPAQLYAAKPETLAVYRGKTGAWALTIEAGDFAPLVPLIPPPNGTSSEPIGKPLETGLRTFATNEMYGIDHRSAEGLLKELPQNDRSTPYRLALTGDLSALGTAEDPLADLFQPLQGRYVSFDLSACTGTAIGDITLAALNRRGNRDRVVTVFLPPTVTTIGNRAFRNCGSLTYIKLPPGLTDIGDSAFSGASFLAAVTLPDTLTGIGEGAFQMCNRLSSIDIPAGVSVIKSHTFSYTYDLRTVVLRKADGVVSLEQYGLGVHEVSASDFAVYVPQAQLTAYKAAANTAGSEWKKLNDDWRWLNELENDPSAYLFRAIPEGM
jgi:hypothetical protein